jgi:LysR family transcriptional activator of nhaA
MEWLNYHHLLYFWLVAREGGLGPASNQLRLAQSTVSAQVRALEEALGEKLFTRSGRRLVMTERGNVVYRYAEEIFSLGRELQDTLRGRPVGRPIRLTVGLADVVPKRVAHRLLEPALHLAQPIHLVCREDKPERLLAELALHEVDVVIADAPAPPTVRVKVFNHPLGECGIVFFAAPGLAAERRRRFPRSLDGAPLLLPTENTSLRRSLDQWFDSQGIRPMIAAEFDDSALLKVFGQAGAGIFPVPSVIADEVRRTYRVRAVGAVDEVRERYFAISAERRLKHPAVVAISEEARERLFG